MVKLTFLSALYTRPGPFACVHVDTSRDIDDPERAIVLRWQHLKQNLEAQGADMRAVVSTRAELIVVPTDEVALLDGVGALLRYPTPQPDVPNASIRRSRG